MPSGSDLLEVNVKGIDGAQTTLHVSPGLEIPSFKELVAEKISNCPAARQKLIFRGKILQDEETIGSYIKEDGLTIHVVIRPETDAAQAPNGTEAAPESQPNIMMGSVNFGSMDGNLNFTELFAHVLNSATSNGLGGVVAPSSHVTHFTPPSFTPETPNLPWAELQEAIRQVSNRHATFSQAPMDNSLRSYLHSVVGLMNLVASQIFDTINSSVFPDNIRPRVRSSMVLLADILQNTSRLLSTNHESRRRRRRESALRGTATTEPPAENAQPSEEPARRPNVSRPKFPATPPEPPVDLVYQVPNYGPTYPAPFQVPSFPSVAFPSSSSHSHTPQFSTGAAFHVSEHTSLPSASVNPFAATSFHAPGFTTAPPPHSNPATVRNSAPAAAPYVPKPPPPARASPPQPNRAGSSTSTTPYFRPPPPPPPTFPPWFPQAAGPVPIAYPPHVGHQVGSSSSSPATAPEQTQQTQQTQQMQQTQQTPQTADTILRVMENLVSVYGSMPEAAGTTHMVPVEPASLSSLLETPQASPISQGTIFTGDADMGAGADPSSFADASNSWQAPLAAWCGQQAWDVQAGTLPEPANSWLQGASGGAELQGMSDLLQMTSMDSPMDDWRSFHDEHHENGAQEQEQEQEYAQEQEYREPASVREAASSSQASEAQDIPSEARDLWNAWTDKEAFTRVLSESRQAPFSAAYLRGGASSDGDLPVIPAPGDFLSHRWAKCLERMGPPDPSSASGQQEPPEFLNRVYLCAFLRDVGSQVENNDDIMAEPDRFPALSQLLQSMRRNHEQFQ